MRSKRTLLSRLRWRSASLAVDLPLPAKSRTVCPAAAHADETRAPSRALPCRLLPIWLSASRCGGQHQSDGGCEDRFSGAVFRRRVSLSRLSQDLFPATS